MIKKKIVTMLALGLFSVGAMAAGPAFSDVDTDADGAISAEEASKVEGLDIATADTNGDGSLNPEEYAAAAAKM